MDIFWEFSKLISHASSDELLIENYHLSNLERLFEKLDSFLVLKNYSYDNVIFKFFEAHLETLKFRFILVQKLYSERDASLLDKKYYNDRKYFVYKSLMEWPRLRNRQRSHYCFYFGPTFVDTASPIECEKWDFLHFSDKNYQIEPELVQNWQDESDFTTSTASNRDIYRDLNEFLVEFDNLLQKILYNQFYNHPCFDDLCVKLHHCRIEIVKLRQISIKFCAGKKDGKMLHRVIQHELEHLEGVDMLMVRHNLR